MSHLLTLIVLAGGVDADARKDGLLRVRVADVLFIHLTELTLDWLAPPDDRPRSWEQVRLLLGAWLATPREAILEIRAAATDQGDQIAEIRHVLPNAALKRQTRIAGLGELDYEMVLQIVPVSINNDLKPPRAQARINVTLQLDGATLIRYSISHDELLEMRLGESRDWDSDSYVRARHTSK